MRGRKPKPTARRRLEGNAGRRPMNQAEPTPPPLVTTPAVDDPTEAPPIELLGDVDAQAEWRRLAPMLRVAGVITEADRASLVALCMQWSRYLEAHRNAARTGLIVKAPSGYPMPNPYIGVANKALVHCTRLWAELGLTPSSRSRVTKTPGLDAPADAFSEFDEVPATKH